LVEPQNHGRRFVSGLASKPLGWCSSVLPQNRWWVSWLSLKTKVVEGLRFGPENRQLRFDDLDLKITVKVSCFGPQNQAVYGLSVAPQNRRKDATAWDTCRDLAACFAWKQIKLWFPSLASRLAEARRQLVHVAPSQRLRRVQAEDGRVNAMGCIFWPWLWASVSTPNSFSTGLSVPLSFLLQNPAQLPQRQHLIYFLSLIFGFRAVSCRSSYRE
jgi:hypothetical protein